MSGAIYLGADIVDATFNHAFRLSPGGTPNTVTNLVTAASANRTLNLPDADDTLIGRNTIDTLTEKTIVGGINGNVVDANIIGGVTIQGIPAAPGMALVTNGVMTADWAVVSSSMAGPPSSTDNAVVRFDGVSGSVVQDSTVTISDAGDILSANSVEVTPVGANPSTVNALWNDTVLGFMHGARALENYCPVSLYANPAGRAAASGSIADPFDDINTAMALPIVATKNGAVINATGAFGAVDLLPLVTITGDGPAMTSMTNVNLTDPTWGTPSPIGINKSVVRDVSITGSITFNAAGMDNPMLIIDKCDLTGGVAATGDNPNATLIVSNSSVGAGITLTDTSAYVTQCNFGVFPVGPATFNINCGGVNDMIVYMSDLAQNCIVYINHTSATASLYVTFAGYFRATVFVQAVGGAGLLNLYIDDVFQIIYSPGTEVLTNKFLLKNSSSVSYDGIGAGLIAVNVQAAIDELAATRVAGPASATDNAVARFDGATGKLIQDGVVSISDAGDITGANSIDIASILANPGSIDTIWNSSALGLMHGAEALEHYSPTSFYVNPDGRAYVDGATGSIADPFDNLADPFGIPAVTSKNGAVINFTGQLTDPMILHPNVALIGDGIGPISILGDISCAHPSWTTPSPFLYNQSFIRNTTLVGQVLFDTSGFTNPLLVLENCNMQGVMDATGYDTTSAVIFLNSLCSGIVNLNNINGSLIDCSAGIPPGAPATINIACDSAMTYPVTVVVSNMSVNCTINISHASVGDVLTVKIIGYFPGSINVSAVSFLGGLILEYDDAAITWSPGTEALTDVRLVKKAAAVAYDNGVSGLTAVTAQAAIDELAATFVAGPASATDNAVARFDGVTGKLIQDGVVTIGDSGDIESANSVTINSIGANPGGAETLWNDSTYGFMHGNRALENYSSTIFYVNTGGRGGLGATGSIADPIADIPEAMGLPYVATKQGAVIDALGTFTSSINLLPNVTIQGYGPNATVLGPIVCNDPAWTAPSAYTPYRSTIRDCAITGTVTFNDAGMTFPFLTFDKCNILGKITASGDIPLGGLIITDSNIGDMDLNDANAYITNCRFSFFPGTSSTINLNCAGTNNMEVYIGGLSNGTININHTSASAYLYVIALGFGGTINVTAVNGAGRLNLTIDDPAAVNYAPGTNALTTKKYAKKAAFVSYSGATSGLTAVTVQDAIDEVATTTGAIGEIFYYDYGTPYNPPLALATPVELTFPTTYTGSPYILSPSAGQISISLTRPVVATGIVRFKKVVPGAVSLSFFLAINGSDAGDSMTVLYSSTSEYTAVSFNKRLFLLPGDLVSIYCVNNTNNDSIDIGSINVILTIGV